MNQNGKDPEWQYAFEMAMTALRRCGFHSGQYVYINCPNRLAFACGYLAKNSGAAMVAIRVNSEQEASRVEKLGFCAHLYSRELAEDFIERITPQRGFDVGLEVSGSEDSFISLFDVLRQGSQIGCLIQFATPFGYNTAQATRNQIGVLGISSVDEACKDVVKELLETCPDELQTLLKAEI